MRVFFLDLWLDLREKRLAPIAIALLAAIIVVPIVIASGSSSNSTPPPAPTATTAAAAPIVVQGTSTTVAKASKLQTFSPRDPFEPTSKPSTSSSSSSGSSSSSTSTTTTSTTSSGGTSTGTTTGETTSPSGGGTTGTTPTTTTPSTGNTTGETKTVLFTYTVDLRFGTGGGVKAYKDVKRLDLIPDDQNPKIVFLGVTATARTAVFLIDNNLGVDTAGGKCQPSADQCTFLYLRPDSDHDLAQLTDSDGTVYHLRLLAIHRVIVSSSNGSTNTNSGSNSNQKKNSSSKSPAFTGSADSNSVPGGDSPPGEPDKQQGGFQQFFADSSK